MRKKIIAITVVLLATVLSFFLLKKPVSNIEAEYGICSYQRLLSFYESEAGFTSPVSKCMSQQAGKIKSVNVKLGERVEANQVVAILDDSEYTAALETLNALLQEAETSASQTSSELYRQRSVYYTMLAQYASSDYKEYTESIEKYIDALNEQIAQVSSTLSVSKQELEAKIEQYTKLADACVIKSPCSGIVSSVNVSENEFCSAAYPVMTISEMDRAYFTMLVSGEDTQRIKSCTEALIEYGGEIFNGKITNISPYAKTDETGIWNEFRIESDMLPDGILLGEKANIKIPTEDAGTVLTIPLSALNMDEAGHYVYKVNGNTLQKAYIDVGQIGFDRAEIVSGIGNNDKVITYSKQKLTAEGD